MNMKRNEDNVAEIARTALKKSEEQLEKFGILNTIRIFLNSKEVNELLQTEYAEAISQVTIVFEKKGERVSKEKLYQKLPTEESYARDAKENAIRRVSASIDYMELCMNRVLLENFVSKIKETLNTTIMGDLKSIIEKQNSMLLDYAMKL